MLVTAASDFLVVLTESLVLSLCEMAVPHPLKIAEIVLKCIKKKIFLQITEF